MLLDELAQCLLDVCLTIAWSCKRGINHTAVNSDACIARWSVAFLQGRRCVRLINSYRVVALTPGFFLQWRTLYNANTVAYIMWVKSDKPAPQVLAVGYRTRPDSAGFPVAWFPAVTSASCARRPAQIVHAVWTVPHAAPVYNGYNQW